jgi:hypothetical protein
MTGGKGSKKRIIRIVINYMLCFLVIGPEFYRHDERMHNETKRCRLGGVCTVINRLWRNQHFLHKFICKETRGDRGCHLDCDHANKSGQCEYETTDDNDSRRLGHRPRYNPRTPSVRKIVVSASMAPLYLCPSTPAFMPVTCIFRRSTSNG